MYVSALYALKLNLEKGPFSTFCFVPSTTRELAAAVVQWVRAFDAQAVGWVIQSPLRVT